VSPAQTISFRFPAPNEPAVNSLTVGTVTQGGVPGATITGTPPNQFLNLVLPNPQVSQVTSFTTNPANTAAFVGEQAAFSATAQSTEAPVIYKWQVSTNGGTTFTDITGAGSSIYSFTPTLADNGKQYRCVAGTPTLGLTNSLIATLTVTNRPAFDGSSWTTGGNTGSTAGISFSSGLFVTGSGAWSTNGLVWTTPLGTTASTFGNIASRPVFGNGTWLAASDLSAVTRSYYTSSDGKNWVARTRPFANTSDSGNITFGFGFGRFVAFWSTTASYYIAGSGSIASVRVIRAAYSTDGINWTACPVITGMVTASNPINTTGTAFTAAQVANTFSSITSVATGGGNSPLMVATGLIPAGATNQYLASADGINWVLKTFPVAIAAQDVAFGGTNFAVVGAGNVALYTPTPATALTTATLAFTQTAMPSTASWSGVTYGNGKFVAVANTSSTAANSTNGIAWVQQALPSSSSWNGVAFGNGMFTAISSAGTAITGNPPAPVITPPVVPPNTLAFTTTPFSVQAVEGWAVVYSAQATISPTEAITYKWQKQEGSSGAWTDITAATGPRLIFNAKLTDSGDSFRCVASTPSAGEVFSSAATCTVFPVVTPPGYAAIATHPLPVWGKAGDTVFFSCTLNAGAGPTSQQLANYQWTITRKGVKSNIGQNAPVLSFQAAAADDGAVLSCRAYYSLPGGVVAPGFLDSQTATLSFS
jgi:hypothetical protein